MAKGELLGFIDCAECDARSPARENKNGGVFYNCPNCGLIYPRLPEGQAFVRARIVPVDGKKSDLKIDDKKGGTDIPGGVAIVAPAPPGEVETPAAAPKIKKSIIDDFL